MTQTAQPNNPIHAEENQTYLIDLKERKVVRIRHNGDPIGFLGFETMISQSGMIRSISFFPEETKQLYLIARDELIDRGLLPNAVD